jgi:hypothetical protein
MYQTEDMRKFQILELIDQIKLLLSFLSEWIGTKLQKYY